MRPTNVMSFKFKKAKLSRSFCWWHYSKIIAMKEKKNKHMVHRQKNGITSKTKWSVQSLLHEHTVKAERVTLLLFADLNKNIWFAQMEHSYNKTYPLHLHLHPHPRPRQNLLKISK